MTLAHIYKNIYLEAATHTFIKRVTTYSHMSIRNFAAHSSVRIIATNNHMSIRTVATHSRLDMLRYVIVHLLEMFGLMCILEILRHECLLEMLRHIIRRLLEMLRHMVYYKCCNV
jgi:hypothetical protein